MAGTSSLVAIQASAQDVVVMRRVIEKPAVRPHAPTPTPSPTPTPTPTPTPAGSGPKSYYNWSVSPWTGGGTCDGGDQTRTVACSRDDGAVVDDSLCSLDNSGPRPVAERFVASTCTFSWNVGQWSDPTNACGTSTETRNVSCLRSDGTTQPDDSCATLGAKPAASQDVSLTTGCGYSWQAGAWGAVAPACGPSSQSRSVVCQRSDGTTIDDTFCGVAGAKPPTSQVVQDMTTCTYSWSAGSFGPPSTRCGDAVETRDVKCFASNGVAAADDALCTGEKPSSTQSSHETDGCPFVWSTGDFGDPVPGCGATVRQRTVSCLRGDGAVVDDSSCKAQRPDATEPATDYSICTFSWKTGDYGDPSSTCGDSVQTRSVSCQRADGTAAPDSSCDAASRPDTSLATHQTSGCSYSWKQGGFGAAAPACGASTRSQTVVCMRGDGEQATDDACSGAGAKPPLTQPATDFSTCTFAWSYSVYSPPSTTCGQATSTRTASCVRSDGTTVMQGCDPAAIEPLTQSTYQTSGCTFSWWTGDYGAPVAACGPSTQSRSVSCNRSDGQPAASDASCTDAKPATSQAVNDYSTCTYSWVVGNWKNFSQTCGETITQTRDVLCQRSTGDFVDAAFCSAAHQPPSSQTISDFSSCTYAWRQTPGTWTATCSPSATRTNTVSCIRSDGTNVSPNGDGFCDAGSKPSTQDTGNLAGCSYAWVSTPGTWSSTCSTSATRSETVVCQRSGDAGTSTVDDSFCSAAGAKPPAQDTGNLAGCSYAWSYGSYGTPSNSCGTATQSRTAQCQRSDGANVGSVDVAGNATGSTSACVSAQGQAATTSAPYDNAAGCTYAGSYGTASSCSPASTGASSGTTSATLSSCARSDGKDVTSANASGSYLYCPQTRTASCSLTYAPVYGTTFGSCTPSSGGSASGTQSAPIASCTMKGSDGSTSTVDKSVCTNNGSAATTSKSCTLTYTPVYSSTYSACSPSSPGSASGTESAAIASCTMTGSDGSSSTVSTSYCSSSAQSSSKSCKLSYSAPVYGAFGTCTATSTGSTTGAQTASLSSCTMTGDDGSTSSVSASACTAAGVAGSSSKSCTISYSATYDTTNYSSCSGGVKSAPIKTCTATPSVGSAYTVDNANCPNQSQLASCGTAVADGGFESGGLSSWSTSASSTGYAPTVLANIAHDGSYALRFHSTSASNVYSAFSQVIPTRAISYTITFWTYSISTQPVVVTLKSASGAVLGSKTVNTAYNGGNQSWAQGSFTVAADGGNDTLSFSTSNNNYGDQRIDTVVMSPILN